MRSSAEGEDVEKSCLLSVIDISTRVTSAQKMLLPI